MVNSDHAEPRVTPAPPLPASHLAIQARRLEARAHLLAKDGKIADALNAGTETVATWRAAVTQDESFIPDLARYLGQFSMRNWTLERFGDALDAAAESVRLWRKLADQDFERYGLELCNAIMRLAPQAARRHYQDFFTLREEGAEILLRLLPADEARYLLPAAQACQRVADMGGSFGHPRKGLSYAEKAVDLWRQLAEQDLLKNGPQLILALNRLSTEQLDPRVGWGKVPLREARRVRLAYLKLRVLNALGLPRSKPGKPGRTENSAGESAEVSQVASSNRPKV